MVRAIGQCSRQVSDRQGGGEDKGWRRQRHETKDDAHHRVLGEFLDVHVHSLVMNTTVYKVAIVDLWKRVQLVGWVLAIGIVINANEAVVLAHRPRSRACYFGNLKAMSADVEESRRVSRSNLVSLCKCTTRGTKYRGRYSEKRTSNEKKTFSE